MRPRLLFLTLLALSALPAESLAASAETVVSGEKRWVLYTAAPGEANQLLVEASTNGQAVRFTDPGAAIEPGSGCESAPGDRVVCRIEQGVLLVQADLGDGTDRADARTANAQAPQINIVGGDGNDVIRGHGPTRFNFSGRAGDDILAGSDGPDVLRGQAGQDFLSGRSGDDLLIGDAGRDVLRAGLGVDRLFGGLHGDKLDARDRPAARDAVVSCGSGSDLTTEDRVDRPKTTGCEIIKL
jgi:RTX calcium-binding nonapeptide repeat (4 copies)